MIRKSHRDEKLYLIVGEITGKEEEEKQENKTEKKMVRMKNF